ncbi:MAG: SoxR reducing system RseC family protein [Clostridia bacterium]|nr:SoxR reducing system RseC family protein [Clostridia bacterium]
MKQKATVVSCDRDRVVVKVDRVSMCDGCHKAGCGDGCAIYKIFGQRTDFSAEASNKAGAAVGDTVIVEASDRGVNLGAFFVFLLPIIIAAAVYLLTSFIKDDNLRLLIAFSSFAPYFAVLVLTEKLRRKAGPRLTVTEIVRHGDESDNL